MVQINLSFFKGEGKLFLVAYIIVEGCFTKVTP
jgi:hypothetical protein